MDWETGCLRDVLKSTHRTTDPGFVGQMLDFEFIGVMRLKLVTIANSQTYTTWFGFLKAVGPLIA